MWGIDIPKEMQGDDQCDGVWPENVPAVEAYVAVSSQWEVIARADGSERVIGLRYGDATVGLRNAGIEVTPALWTDLQMVEIGARAAMNGEAI